MKADIPNFVVLDSWRGIAACIIALTHFQIGVNNHISDVHFFNIAGLFVDFFFVLSGFVIFANYEQRLKEGYGFWRFMFLRFGRLYPLHFTILMVFLGFEALQIAIPYLGEVAVHEPFSQEGEGLGFILAALTLTHSLGFFDDQINTFNGPSWSISTEFYTYAIVAIFMCTLKKRGHLIAVLILLAIGSAWILYESEAYLKTTLQLGLFRCIYSFAIGAMLWYVFSMTRKAVEKSAVQSYIWGVGELVLVCAVFYIMDVTSGGVQRFAIPFLFALLIWVFAFEKGFVSSFLKYKLFTFLGLISYSIYMTHSFIAGKAAGLAGYISNKLPWNVTSVSEEGEIMLGATIWQGDFITVVYFLLVVGCSFITFKLIEEPCRSYSRKLAATS